MAKLIDLDGLSEGLTSLFNKVKSLITKEENRAKGVETTLSTNIETLSAESVRFGDSLQDIESELGPNVSNRITELSGEVERVSVNMNGFKLWSGTQGEYDAIKDKDSSTIYMIIEEE